MSEDLKARIEALEAQMLKPDFWANKDQAQAIIRDIQVLKEELAGAGKYDKGDAIVTVFAGAGGDDAEDFSRILLEMYLKYAERKNFGVTVLHENQNTHGGYRNITFEVHGRGAYGILKHESGVHRLVRISPFNAKKLRHTSFSLVEVVPKFAKADTEMAIPEDDLEVEFSRSSGPGGQNVNKRETAVRVVHKPTGLAVHCESERSQQQNRERALEILKGKLYKRLEEERMAKEKGLYVSKTTEIEWGNQIRSYVFHPYKLVKDHRTEAETSDVDAVLEGDIDLFIEAEQNLQS
ncbi:MAG TPA: PCRF domain-containing protein [Candidatus Paceibacterota bacterium]|nr:PCRF domain-containing protein [Candidatus Paceibacterota bacterium]